MGRGEFARARLLGRSASPLYRALLVEAAIAVAVTKEATLAAATLAVAAVAAAVNCGGEERGPR